MHSATPGTVERMMSRCTRKLVQYVLTFHPQHLSTVQAIMFFFALMAVFKAIANW